MDITPIHPGPSARVIAFGPMPVVYDDGGRADAGFQGQAGDCVTRSIAIAEDRLYREVYDALADGQKARGRPRSARNGVSPSVYKRYLEGRGFTWTPTMGIGTGCQVHMLPDELPRRGRLVVRLSGHLTAVIGGVVHDTHDPCRGGERCVYGFWRAP